MGEDIVKEVANAENNSILLRYFNPVGAHPSGLIGENPRGVPNNLMPSIAHVAIGELKQLQVFGNDYPTPDGTGIRDYIHVMDLAEVHIAALTHLFRNKEPFVVNVGTGYGHERSLLCVFRRISSTIALVWPYGLVGRIGDVSGTGMLSGIP